MPTEVTIVHDGPVHVEALSNIMTIECKPISCGVWTDVSDDFAIDATSAHSGLRRDIVIEPMPGEAFQNHSMYRMQPNTGRLACSNVDGCPDVDCDPNDFEFTIDVA